MLSYLGDDNLNKIKLFLKNKKISKIYFNNNKIVDDILNNTNNHLYCFDAFYFNKCYLKEEELLYDFDDDEFINKFRELIKPEYQKYNLDSIDSGILYEIINKNEQDQLELLF